MGVKPNDKGGGEAGQYQRQWISELPLSLWFFNSFLLCASVIVGQVIHVTQREAIEHNVTKIKVT